MGNFKSVELYVQGTRVYETRVPGAIFYKSRVPETQ